MVVSCSIMAFFQNVIKVIKVHSIKLCEFFASGIIAPHILTQLEMVKNLTLLLAPYKISKCCHAICLVVYSSLEFIGLSSYCYVFLCVDSSLCNYCNSEHKRWRFPKIIFMECQFTLLIHLHCCLSGVMRQSNCKFSDLVRK